MPASPARPRYLGLVATVLLAAAAYLSGALPFADPAVAVRRGDPRAIAGLAVWLAGTVLLAIAWWRLRFSHDLRWLLVTGALWALPLLVAPPLGSRDVYAYACQGALYLDGHDPYAVGAQDGGCPWLSAVPRLWHDTPTPYGPLAVLASAAAVAVARALPLTEGGQLLVAVGLLRAVALIGIAIMTWYGVRLARVLRVDPVPAVWLGVATPLVLVHAVAGGHNDALLAGLLVAGLAVAVRPGSGAAVGAALGAGALLGLAVAVKVTALVALPFAVLLVAGGNSGPPVARPRPTRADPERARSSGPNQEEPAWRPILRGAALVGGAAVAVFAALSAATGLGLGWVGALRDTGSLVQWTSLPTGLGMAAGYLLRVLGWPEASEEAVAVARALGLVVLAGLVLALWLWARQRARQRAAASARAVVLACGAALAAAALLAPVFYPWYALAPLAVLAFSTVEDRVRRGLAVATVALVFLVLPYGLGLAVLTKLPGALLDVALVVALAWWWWRRRGQLPRDSRQP